MMGILLELYKDILEISKEVGYGILVINRG